MSPQPYSATEVAKAVGVSRQTLHMWISRDGFKPPRAVKVGGATVRMWTDADIERARKFKGTVRRGRKTKK
jgi:DNA-binding transcriptional MerR regulator